MSAVATAPLLAEPGAFDGASRAGAAVFLIGGYDGSGNYGDMLQLQATLQLLAHLGDHVAPIVVLESEHRAGHAELVTVSPQLGTAPVCYFDSGGEGTAGDLEPLVLPPGVAAACLYLYGGGYLNPDWGPRKLAMAHAVEAAARAAGLPAVPAVSSGLQVDAPWAAGLEPQDAGLLRRLEVFGVRDRASLALRGGVMTGDDAVGVIGDRLDDGSADPAGDRLRINLHAQDSDWVTGDGSRLAGFLAGIAEGLERHMGKALEVQPVIAYEDRRVSERPMLRAVAERLGGRIAGEPVVLRPGGLEASLATLGRAALTVSCSYHAALTSLLLGVPAALVAENPYYAQKAAGLTADFGLTEAFVLDPGAEPRALAAGLAAALAPDRRPDVRDGLRLGAARSVARRREAEVLILGHLARALASALAAARRPEPARAAELMERLAVLRIDHQELQAAASEGRAELTALRSAHDELLAGEEVWQEHAARSDRLEAELRELRATHARVARAYAVNLESRSWRLTGPFRRARALLRPGSR